MARDVGLSQATAHRYLGLLEVSHLLYRLPAFSVNRTKRVMKSPRLFFCDSGLACFLAGIETEVQLGGSDIAGFLYENLVLQDLLAWNEANSGAADILHWRTTDGKEVDFVLECGGNLLPVEVKTTRRARVSDISGLLAFLQEYQDMASHGVLIYGGNSVERMTENIWAIPLKMALGLP